MVINRRFFPKIINDNDEVYFNSLLGVIESIDEYASVEITYEVSNFRIRIAPSLIKYIPSLIEEILKFNNLCKIKIDMSKSMKASGVVSFTIKVSSNENS